MKVRLIKDKEINGELAKSGWVYGVDEPTAQAWIAAGEAVAVVDEARALRYAENMPVMLECVIPDAPSLPQDAPAFKGKNVEK